MTKNLFFIFIGLLIFTGCSKASKNTNPPTSAIVGKWTLSVDSDAEYVNGVRTIYDVNPVEQGAYRQFNADGTGVDYYPADTTGPALSTNVTWSLSGSNVNFSYPAYIYNGYNFPARTDVYTILALTGNKLGIRYSDNADLKNALIQYYWYTK